MALPPIFRTRRTRSGVSELYAAVLMIGVTISVGSLVVAAASSQFGLAADSASLGSSIQQTSAEVQLGLVYVAVPPSGSCPSYQGFQEGTTLTVALFDFGSAGFSPAGFVVNSTVVLGSYGTVGPGALGQFVVALGSCAHHSGLVILAYDSAGDEVQFGT
ncbi:MAG: hypothetical protein KGI38_07720 [Thaumarchaeota archaeon]|nr:hypothetical protein [Nitrososphaerota archaeon]